MSSPVFPYPEAVDPNLQAVAAQSLHWLHIDAHTCELRKLATEPQLDGFDKQSVQVLGLIRLNPNTRLHLGYVHRLPGVIVAPPAMHILSKQELGEAKTTMLRFLMDINRL